MAINRVEIKDFLVFKGIFTVDFCPGVNIFIGGNGTGKTTLLKIMYGLINDKISRCFYAKNINENIFNGNGRIDLLYGDNAHNSFIQSPYQKKFLASIQQLPGRANRISVNEVPACDVKNVSSDMQSVFIPDKDMLSHSPGFLALKHERPMVPFDDTLTDIIAKAQLYPKNETCNNNLCNKIREIIGGEVTYDNDSFIVLKDNSSDQIPFSMEASGYRKLGLLWKLIQNGLLEKSSILFWDEPENSLNPEIIPVLVDILLELSRGGVQIFIATHSYDIARWFELNKTDDNSLRYFNLRNDANGIIADIADDYKSLPNCVIEYAGNQLLRRVTEVAAKNAGVKLNDTDR